MNRIRSLCAVLALSRGLLNCEAFVVSSFPTTAHYVSPELSSASSTARGLSGGDDEGEGGQKKGGFLQGFANFWAELDAFMDDASARRLGNGAAFYGKRKSNFYGEKDRNRKVDRNVFDATEDYQGPSSSGYFGWMTDESGEWRPVSRMKNQALDNKRSKM